jgi:hypothetical protein
MLLLKKPQNFSPFLLLSLIIVGSVRLLTWLASPSGNLQPDSPTYLPTAWLNFDKVSILGNSQRGWVTPLIYSLLPNNPSRIFFQLLLGFICWSTILIVSYLIFKKKKALNFVMAFEVFLAIAPFTIQFETVLIPTSFLIYSLLLFTISTTYMVYFENYSSKNLLTVILLGWICLSLKSSNVFIVSILLAYILFISRKKMSAKKVSIGVLIAVLVMGHGVVVGINNDKFWTNSYSGTAILWHLGDQAPNASSFSDYLRSKDVPECVVKNAPFGDIAKEISLINSDCPEGNAYIKSELQSDLMKFLFQDPLSIIKLVSVGVAVAMTSTSSHYGSSVSILPESLSGLFFGNVSPDFRVSGEPSQSAAILGSGSGEPLWIAMPSIFYVAFGLFLAFTAIKRRVINKTLILVSGLAIFEILLTVLILPSEWFRQNSHYLLTLYLMSTISIGMNTSDFFRSSNKEIEQ